MRVRRGILLASALLVGGPQPSPGQSPDLTLVRERQAFAEWLRTGATSPYAVLAHRAIGPGLHLGPPDADLPLPGLPSHRLRERDGVVFLEAASGTGPLPRFRPVPLGGGYRVEIGGSAGRSVVTVFAPGPRNPRPPSYYPYDPRLVLTVTLERATTLAKRRLLAADGVEVEATLAGAVAVRLGGATSRLAVYRIPDPAGDEAALEIYFRDLTNDGGTYPAGRFVTLESLGADRYRLDFNRARNPYCAYSTVFACPLPWRGNALPVPIAAGEKYTGGGLTPPKLDPP
jgi:hypothetical protein